MSELSIRAQAVLDALKERQATERPFMLGQPSTGKAESCATWRELVDAGIVTEANAVKGVSRYEIAAQGVTV